MKVKSRKLNIFIKQKKDRPNLNLVLKAEVYLPIKVYKQLTVHSISGDVYVNTNNIIFLNIDLESVNGNIDFFSESEVLERTIKELNNIKVSTESGDIIIFNRVKYGGNNYFYIDSKIYTISGDIKLNLDSANMDILTTSGDVTYTDSVTADLKIISCSGDINSNIITVSDTKAFLQTVSGDINFDATDISNCIYNGRLIEKGGHNSLFLQCKTVSGEINYK